jgi:hypothetical protein
MPLLPVNGATVIADRCVRPTSCVIYLPVQGARRDTPTRNARAARQLGSRRRGPSSEISSFDAARGVLYLPTWTGSRDCCSVLRSVTPSAFLAKG